MNYPVFIDIEASGLSFSNSYPIQIAFNNEQGDIVCSYIKPADDWTYWDMAAEKIHQITREKLFEHGINITEAATMLNRNLRGKRVYSDAVTYDLKWLDRLFIAAGFKREFKLKNYQDLAYRMKQYENWGKISERAWQQVDGQRHSADVDVKHHMKMFDIMKKK